jgi:hypothetical protein
MPAGRRRLGMPGNDGSESLEANTKLPGLALRYDPSTRLDAVITAMLSRPCDSEA